MEKNKQRNVANTPNKIFFLDEKKELFRDFIIRLAFKTLYETS